MSSKQNTGVVDDLIQQVISSGKFTDEKAITGGLELDFCRHGFSYYIMLLHVAATKKYFESQVQASKEVSISDARRKRMVSRRTKVHLVQIGYTCTGLLFITDDDVLLFFLSFTYSFLIEGVNSFVQMSVTYGHNSIPHSCQMRRQMKKEKDLLCIS